MVGSKESKEVTSMKGSVMDRLNLCILEQDLHCIEIPRHQHFGVRDNLLVDDTLIGKLNGRGEIHEVAQKGETPIL